MSDQCDFFISYNSADAAHAAAINAALRDNGYSTHFAGTDTEPGTNLAVWMDDALFTSVQVLALCSPDYFKPEAEYSPAERSAAFWADPTGARAKLVPVEIRPTEYRPLYAPLRRITETSGQLPDEAAAALIAALNETAAIKQREAQRIAASTPPVFEVPRSRLPTFFGRDEALAALHQTLARGQAAAVTQVLGGMGGVGKTTLAAEYAHRFGTAGRYAGVWWIPAETEPGIVESLSRLAERLGAPKQADLAAMARAALAHVGAGKDAEGKPNSLPWLMIYDNVPNPDGLFARNPDGCRGPSWLPAGAARVIVTSRWDDFSGIAATTPLDVWTEATAADFLLARTDRDDRAGAATLARVLGGLPLAAEQVAAFLRPRTGIAFARYAEDIEKLIDKAPDPGDTGAYGRTVYATLTTSLAQLSQATRDLLCLLAWLSEDGTEVEIIGRVAKEWPDLLSDGLAAAFADDFAREDAIKPAVDLSLLRRAEDAVGWDMLILHRVTALVLRLWQVRAGIAGWANSAARIVGTLFPFDSDEPKNWALCARLFPHAQALARRGPDTGDGGKMRSLALNQAAGYHLVARGDLEGALALFEAPLPVTGSSYGEESADYAITLSNLAGRYKHAGQMGEAEHAYKRAIVIEEKILGLGDPSLAVTYNNFAEFYFRHRAFSLAEPLLIRARDIVRAVHGHGSLQYAEFTNSLGALYEDWADEPGESERRTEAARLKQEAVAVGRSTVGERHPRMSLYLHNLAITLFRQGEPAAAANLALRAVAIQLSLGLADHPDTVRRSGTLVAMWNESGRTEPWKSALQSEILAVERLMHDWVAEDPANRDFGPPPFAEHNGKL